MRTHMTIDLRALRRNYDRVRRIAGGRRRVIAVVKADAYGHGAVLVAREVAQYEGTMLGVALVEEALQLRDSGIRAPILVLYEPDPEDIEPALRHELALSIESGLRIETIARAAARVGRRAALHVRVDTGLGPPGIPVDAVDALIGTVRSYPMLCLRGVFTHMADPSDDRRTYEQLARFRKALARVGESDTPTPLIHAAGTGSILRHPATYCGAVRPGTILYGRPRTPDTGAVREIESIATWRTHITHIAFLEAGRRLGYGTSVPIGDRRRIAVIPVGYADGLRKGLSETREVLVRGHRVPIIGRPAMDSAYLDVTALDVAPNDEVILLGSQGDAEITAAEVGVRLGMPTPAVWCGITSRVARVYVRDSNAPPSPVPVAP